MRWFICVVVFAWFAGVAIAAGPITLGGQGDINPTLINATLDSASSTTTPSLTAGSLTLAWNGIVTWTGTRGTATQKMEHDQFVEFNVNFPTQISNFTITGNYKWVNGGGSFTDPTSKSFANAEIYQYVDSNNNGHFDYGIDDLYQVPLGASTPMMTVTGNGFGIKTATFTDPSNYVLGPGTNYILLAEVLDTSSFTQPNSGDPDNIYTAEFPSPNFGGIEVSFNYVTVPEPATLMFVAATGLLLLLQRRLRRIGRI